MCDVTLTVLS